MKLRMLIWIATLMLAGCGFGMTAEQRVDKARNYLADDNVPAAIIELKNALQDDPIDLDARLLLAEASLRVGDADTAAKEYERALDLGAEIEPIRSAFAEALVRAGRNEKGLEFADPAGTSGTERARMQWIRGLALTGMGRFEEAEEALEEARTDSNLAFVADIARARLELARGDSAALRSVLDVLSTDGQEDSEYWEILGLAQIQERRAAAAAESFEKALSKTLEPFGERRFMLRGNLAEARLASGDVEGARKVAERLYRDAKQHPLSNYLMSRVEYQSGNHQQSLAFAQALLSMQPGHPIGNILAGAASLAMNQPAQAENYLARAVEAEPSNATARKLLAQVRLGMGSPQDALAALRPIAGRDPEAAAMAGVASLGAGDPSAAIELFRRELAADPENEQLRIQLAVSLMAAGRNDEALAELSLLKGLDEAAQLRVDLVGVAAHLQAGDLATARTVARAAADSRPDDPQVRNTLGALFAARGYGEEGVDWLHEALQVDPGNAVAEFNLGRVAAAAGRSEEAERRFKAVLNALPENVAAQTALAQVAWSAGRRDDAIGRLEKLRSADSSALQPRLVLARFLQANGEPQRALEVAREAFAANPASAEAAYTLGQMLSDADHHAEALRAFEKANEIAPGTPSYMLGQSRSFLASGQIDAARQELRNALAVNPEFLPALFSLVALELHTGRTAEASKALEQLKITAESDDPAVALLEGELFLARREYEAAIPRFQSAVNGDVGWRAIVGLFNAQAGAGKADPENTLEGALKSAPDDLPLRMRLADYYLTTGRHGAAAGHYEELVTRQPGNPALLNNLAWLYDRAGDSRALGVAEQAYKLAPGSPLIMDTYGWILHKRGDTRRALALISEAAQLAPDMGEIRYHHAVLLKETGNRTAAIGEARAVLADHTAVQHHADAQALLERLGQGQE